MTDKNVFNLEHQKYYEDPNNSEMQGLREPEIQIRDPETQKPTRPRDTETKGPKDP